MPTSTPKSSVDGLASDRADTWQRTFRIYAPLVSAWVQHFGVRGNDVDAMTLELMLVILRRLPNFRKQSPTDCLVDWMWNLTRSEITRRVRSQLINSPKNYGRTAGDSPTMPELPEAPPDIRVANGAVLLRAIEVAKQSVASETMRAFDLNVIHGQELTAVARLLRVTETEVIRSRIGVRDLIHQLLERIDLPESIEALAPSVAHKMVLTSGNLDKLELAIRAAAQDAEAVSAASAPWRASWDQFLNAYQASDQAERMSLAADSIPGYRIKGWLGRGGMGEVYLARHMSLHRDVALKICAQSGWSTLRFDREMRLAGKLEHPNIVQTYDAGRTGQLAYIAMEHIVGNNLSQLVTDRHPLTVEVVAEILRQSLQALIHIHSAGIVHRDVKPSNIMLTEQGRIKLLDLGVAMEKHPEDQPSHAITSTHHHLGTAAYAAPEQGFDRAKVGPLSDIYGLGCTAYFMLVGHHPYDGGTSVELYVKHRDAAIPDVHTDRPDVPFELSHSIQRMMAKLPHDRPTANELLGDLSSIPAVSLDGIATAPAISSLFDSTAHTANGDALVSTANQSDIAVSHPSRASKWLAVASLVCVLVMPLIMLALLRPVEKGYTREFNSNNSRIAKVRFPVLHALSELQSTLLENRPDIKATLEELSIAPKPSDAKIQAMFKLLGDLNSPDVRTGLIHWVPAYIPFQAVIDCLRDNQSPHVRAALIQMLGVYEPRGAQAMVEFESLKTASLHELSQLYLNETHPEVHASLRWLAQRWGCQQKWNEMRSVLQQKMVPFSGGIYQPLLGPTMVVFSGPIDAQIGSPVTETGRSTTKELDERLRTTHIPRSFAIANTEVTRWLYWRVGQRHLSSPEPDDPELPQNAVQWQDAAYFCNQLSELEGIPASEFCYEVINDGQRRIVHEFPDSLERTGYRLPTDDEWEVAARAGTKTARPFGNEIGWKHEYAAMEGVESQLCPVASRKPNPNGLFDMLGNISEWTNDPVSLSHQRQRHARGGSVWTTTDAVRTASRFAILERMPKAHEKLGFRVARTLRQIPLELPEGVALLAAPNDLPKPSISASIAARPIPESANFDPVDFQQPIQFGTWKAGNVPIKRLRLVNNGNSRIRIDAKLSNSLFAFASSPASELKPSSHTEFGLRVSASLASPCFAELQLEITVPGQTTRTAKIQIAANVEGSVLLIEDVSRFESTELRVDMGDIPVGARIGRDFLLINAGSQSTQPRVIDVSDNLHLDRNINAPLAPSGRNFFHVTLNTNQPGQFLAAVRLHSSDAETKSNEIKINANVIESNRFRYPGVFRKGLWLFNHNGDGQTFEKIEFGDPASAPLTGDWNGDGLGDMAACKLNAGDHWQWSLYLRGATIEADQRISQFTWGTHNDRPIAADINGDGKCEFGLIRLHALPKNEMDTTEFKIAFDTDGDQQSDVEHSVRWTGQNRLELEDALFFAGDIDGDHVDEILLTRTPQSTRDSTRIWTINSLQGSLDERLFGLHSHFPFVGDWNGDGKIDLGSATEDGNTLRFLLNFDDDPYAEADIRDWAKPSDIPVTIAK
jgi:serine/threonine protein kinase/formylglycine-generating enzyme required for sulfatase activity